MGVYAKGANMPKSCGECCVLANACDLWEHFDERAKTRHPDCPLVEVKASHGDLIDSEYIYNAVERRYRVSSGVEHRAERDFLDLICIAPTVIEAEGNDETDT